MDHKDFSSSFWSLSKVQLTWKSARRTISLRPRFKVHHISLLLYAFVLSRPAIEQLKVPLCWGVLVADAAQCSEGVSFFAVRRLHLADVPVFFLVSEEVLVGQWCSVVTKAWLPKATPSALVQSVGRAIRPLASAHGSEPAQFDLKIGIWMGKDIKGRFNWSPYTKCRNHIRFSQMEKLGWGKLKDKTLQLAVRWGKTVKDIHFLSFLGFADIYGVQNAQDFQGFP